MGKVKKSKRGGEWTRTGKIGKGCPGPTRGRMTDWLTDRPINWSNAIGHIDTLRLIDWCKWLSPAHCRHYTASSGSRTNYCQSDRVVVVKLSCVHHHLNTSVRMCSTWLDHVTWWRHGRRSMQCRCQHGHLVIYTTNTHTHTHTHIYIYSRLTTTIFRHCKDTLKNFRLHFHRAKAWSCPVMEWTPYGPQKWSGAGQWTGWKSTPLTVIIEQL